jgi:hypothetical protein
VRTSDNGTNGRETERAGVGQGNENAHVTENKVPI